MRRQLSLGMLFARSSLWRVLGILILMAALQAGLAWYFLRGDGSMAAEYILDDTLFRLTSALGLTGIVAVVMLSAGGFGSRVNYSVSRLPVPRWTVLVWAVGYALAVLALFWAVQTAVCLGVLRWYSAVTDMGRANPQLTVLAAYRSSLFHTVLPLRDGTRLAATIGYFLGLAVVTGTWSVRAFSGKWSAVPLILAAAWWFRGGGVGSVGWNLLLAVATLCWAFGTVMELWKEERA